MSFPTEPKDLGGIPISSVYGSGNTFPALQGMSGAYVDSASNPSTGVVVGFAPPAIVQKAHNVTGSGGKTLTCAFPNDNTAGNSIVVVMGMGEVEGAGITLAVTDTNSNTYKQAVSASQSTTLEASIFYATPIAIGANTVTLTISGGSSSNTAISCEVYEVWGVITQVPGALDQTATGNSAGSTSPATGAITLLVPNELAFAAIAAAGGTITAGANWTLDSGSLSPTGGNLVSFGSESLSLSTIVSVSATATLSGSNAWAIAMATFKPVIVPVVGTVTTGPIVSGISNWTWVTATSQNTVHTIANNSMTYNTLVFQFNPNSFVTGGAITVEGSIDNVKWNPINVQQINGETGLYPYSGTELFMPASIPIIYQVAINVPYVQIRLSTAITGSGASIDFFSVLSTGSNFGATSQMGVTLVSNLNGYTAAISSANAVHTNLTQVAGGTASNAGQTGAMQVGGAVATNTNVSSATNPLLIAGSDYGGTPKVQNLKVDSLGIAQVAITNTPTITANAGTNLNTSALAVESGGNLATLAGAITSAKVQANVAQINGATVTMGNGVSGTGVQRVTLASDSTGQVSLATGSTTAVTQGTASNLNAQVVGSVASAGSNAGNPVKVGGVFNTTQPTVTNGQIVDTQTTARGAQIVATGTDTFNVTVNAAIPTGGNTIGAVTQASGPWTSNVTQINSASISTAASGVQKVGVVGNTGATVDSTVAAGTAPTNSLVMGTVYNSTAPAPTNGQAMATQADQAGNARMVPGIALTTLSGWTNGTSLNATQTIYSNSGVPAVLVHLVQTSTFSAGAITFEVSYDNTNWVTIPASAVMDPSSASFATISLPYTLVASTNKPFFITNNGWQGLRIKLSTAITGSGTVTPNYALLPYDPAECVIAYSPTAANFNATASQGGTWTVGANSATGSTVPANAFYMSGDAATVLPTAGTGGNLTGAMVDKYGRQIVMGGLRELKGNQQTTITSSTSETTIVTAGGSGVFCDLYCLILNNSSATACNVTIKDSTAGTTRFVITVPAGDVRGFSLPQDSAHVQASANNNWTATCSASVASVYVTALFVNNK